MVFFKKNTTRLFSVNSCQDKNLWCKKDRPAPSMVASDTIGIQ